MVAALVMVSVIAAAAAGVAVWLGVSRARLSAELAAARNEGESARRSAGESEATLAAAREECRRLEAEAITARAGLAAAERAREEIERQVERVKAESREAFDALAARALQQTSEQFLKLAEATLASQQEKSRSELGQSRAAFENLVRPISETLARQREELARLQQQVGHSEKTADYLRQETSRLVAALSKPNVRGRYGEIQLRRVVELAGMEPYCDFTEQTSVRDGEGRVVRPDMVVTLPNDRCIAVDAKTPTEAYMSAMSAATPEEAEEHLARFADNVATQVKLLADKRYWAQFKGSPEFVVMFVPGDQFVDAALTRRPDLIEKAAEARVILASPSTLIGLLRAVAVGWGEHRLAENAQRLTELGRELHERVGKVFEHAAGLGVALRQAVDRYNDTVGSIDARLVPTLRKFEEAGIKSGKQLEQLPDVALKPRMLEAAEGLFVENGEA